MITNLVVPIGGLGSRYANKGYLTPKPLIEIDGMPMIRKALSTLKMEYENLYIGLRKFDGYEDLIKIVNSFDSRAKFHIFDEVTEGPAITVKNIIKAFDIRGSMLTINCDQIMNWDPKPLECIIDVMKPNGVVVTFEGGEEKHSFVKHLEGVPTLFAEKIKISNTALTGIHYFKNTDIYMKAAESAIKSNDRAPNGEYYMSLLYNYINKVQIYHIPRDSFYPVGTPEELEQYLRCRYVA